MKVLLVMAALAAVAGSVRADSVTHTAYGNTSRVQKVPAIGCSADGWNGRWCPVALGVVPGLEAPGRDWQVMPLRINLFVGRHHDVYGLDLGGFGNLVTRDFGGVQAAFLFNCIGESSGGLQFAGCLNRCMGMMEGAQFGLVNVVEKGCGLQVGLVNYGNVFHGVQIGAVNVIRASTCPVMPVVNFAF